MMPSLWRQRSLSHARVLRNAGPGRAEDAPRFVSLTTLLIHTYRIHGTHTRRRTAVWRHARRLPAARVPPPPRASKLPFLLLSQRGGGDRTSYVPAHGVRQWLLDAARGCRWWRQKHGGASRFSSQLCACTLCLATRRHRACLANSTLFNRAHAAACGTGAGAPSRQLQDEQNRYL